MTDILSKGGPVLFILLGLSIFSVHIIIQKFLFFRLNRFKRADLIEQIKTKLLINGRQATIQDLTLQNTHLTRILSRTITLSDQPLAHIDESIKDLTRREFPKFDQNLSILGSIITVAPILGLLGTVIGLMDIFNVISGGGIGDAQALSSGIAQALITTVAGLSIAIPLIFLSNLIAHKLSTFIADLEHVMTDIIDFCNDTAEIKP